MFVIGSNQTLYVCDQVTTVFVSLRLQFNSMKINGVIVAQPYSID